MARHQASGKYAGRELFIGSVTDPYNPQEETFGRTRELLLQLKGSGANISIATKSDLVLRDLELIKSFPDARVSWSINTLDEDFRKDMDEAVSIERRLAAMEAFHRAGCAPPASSPRSSRESRTRRPLSAARRTTATWSGWRI